MELPALFTPPRRPGLIFNGVCSALLLVTGVLSILYALNRAPDEKIAIWYLAGILQLAPMLLFVYRAYSLLQARYLVDRDGLRIRWGLRSEDISMKDIEWVRPAADLGYSLRRPLISWPGSVYGRRETEGLGTVEFLASESKNLLLIASYNKVYAISPSETRQFLNTFRRAVEMGSLTQLSTSTTLPTAYFKRIWGDVLARRLLVSGIVALIVLVLVTGLCVSTLPQLSMGYDSTGQPYPPGPSQYMLLLPILGAMVFVFDLLYGMFLYRRQIKQIMAYFLWGSSIFASLLLLTGMIVAAL